MGGPAVFAGTNYQAGVIAYVFAHVLAYRRLDWLTPVDDTPSAVSAETGGPGDDVRIEFGEAQTFEVQAKAGLTGEVALAEALRGIANRAGDDPLSVVLVVDRRSSGWIYRDFATELERISGGRLDVLPKAAELHAEFGDALKYIRVKAVDVSPPDDPEAERAKDLLARVLVDADQAPAAWALLLEAAADVAARRLREDRAALVELLVERGIAVRALSPDERWLAELDFVRQLLERRHAGAALSILEQVSNDLRSQRVDAEVRYWLARHRATALLQLSRPGDALTSARQALDVKPDGPEALVSASIAALQLGDIPAARRYADDAIASAPESAKAWGAVAQVNAATGVDLREPPGSVASSSHYRTVLAEIATVRGDADRALELTGLILEGGERPPEVLVLRATALLELGRDATMADIRENAEVERIASEAIEELDDVHPFKAKALVLRAAAKRAAGRLDEADADLQLAASVEPDDPDVVRNLAALRLQAGDDDGALELLHRPVASNDALLVAVRAEILARHGRHDEAARDLERGLGLLPDAHDPDAARFALADAALELEDVEGAARALDGLSEPARERPIAAVFVGRIAFARGNMEDAIASYRDGAERAGAMRDAFLTELAVALVRVGRHAEAAAVFNEVPAAGILEEARRAYVLALMRIKDLAQAQEQIDVLAGSGPLPAWALGVAVDIALAREDQDAAIAHLTELVDRGHATQHVRIVLAHQLIEARRLEDAAAQVEALMAAGMMAAEERMQMAELLRELGRGPEAVDQAFTAFREARDDPRMHRALAGMVFASRIDIPPLDGVGPDTHVRLRDEHGEERSHTILAEPPYHPGQNEISVDDARTLGLLGKRQGDVVIEHEGSWQAKRWTVEEIIPAVVHYARDAIAQYGQRFPGEPFFATAVHVGDGSAPGDYTRVIQALGERRAQVEETIGLLREQVVPLGMVVRILGGSISDLMDTLVAAPDQLAPLWVEWDDAGLQAWSVDQARGANEVVIARSSLKTMFDVGIADTVRAGYHLVAPSSLLDELRSEVAEARDQVEHGRGTMIGGDIGIRIDDVAPGDPQLVERLRKREGMLNWVTAQVRIEARPLEWIKPEDSSPTALRQMVGKSSYDALVLATHLDATLYADDLGLRRLALTDRRPRSFATISLVPVLAERGLVDGATRDRLVIALAIRSYVAVPPSSGLLIGALHATPALSASDLARVFASLGRPGANPAESARIVGLVCRAAATESVRIVSAERVAELSLEALASRIPKPLAATLVEHAAAETLALLPRDLDAVRRACARFGGR
jgi:tetratricopeptide (TPR) repeat protein